MERFETAIGLLVSVLSALTALIAAVTRLLTVLLDESDELDQSELAKDVVRLDDAVQAQQRDVAHLRQQLQAYQGVHE